MKKYIILFVALSSAIASAEQIYLFMKKTLCMMSVSIFVASSAFATSFDCNLTDSGYDGFGRQITVHISDDGRNISFKSPQGNDPSGGRGEFLPYKRAPKELGRIRYEVDVMTSGSGSGCDSAILLLDKGMANGRNGNLIISYDCDSDGTGPVPYPYACIANY